MSTGRKEDPLQRNFIEIPATSSSTTGVGKAPRVKCKHCRTFMMGLIPHMRAHLEKYSNYASRNLGASTSSSKMEICENDSSDDGRGATSEKEKHKIDIQVARYFYATNTPFRHSEHPEFINLMQLSRPDYLPPNEKNMGGKFLDEVYDTVKSNMENNLKGKVVCMAFDVWSNAHNEPIVCVSVTTVENDGSGYIIDTIDTSSNSHTGDYLLTLAIDSIKKCRSFGCNVRSFVTNNVSNMAKMRRQLMELEDDQIGDVITYGCSAYLINLFAKDIEEAEIKDKVKYIIKYFKDHNFSKYKDAGGKALVLPQDISWNTLADCLESYVNNWNCLVKVCSEQGRKLDSTIVKYVQDVVFKEKVENYLKKLKKIARALDLVQKDMCVLSDCTRIWKDLLSSDWLPKEAEKLEKRFKVAMTPAHFAAYILDPNYNGEGLSEEEDTKGMQFLESRCPHAMKDVLTYRARSYPFSEYMFKKELLMKTHVSVWWKSLRNKVDPEMLDITRQLFTATASFGIGRLFSTFGLVHSKLRNKLGTEKAAKSVAIMRALNQHSSLEKLQIMEVEGGVEDKRREVD